MNKSSIVYAVTTGALLATLVAAADDPVLLFRSPTYGLAFARILAQALASTHAAPFSDR